MNQIINKGDDRQCQGEVDHNLLNDMDSRPAEIWDHKNDGNHSNGGFILAPYTGCNDGTTFSSNKTEAADNKFSGNDNKNNPCRHTMHIYETDQCRADKQFICQGIHKLAEIGDQIILSGYLAVKHIRQAGNDKYNQGNIR